MSAFNKQWQQPLAADNDRINIVKILETINLDYPGLEKVKSAKNSSDYPLAAKELLHYFRRTRMHSGKVSIDKKSASHANDALQHKFRGNGDVHPPIFRNAKIDWVGKAFKNQQEIHDAEWYFQFQRLTWWPALAKAYDSTNE